MKIIVALFALACFAGVTRGACTLGSAITSTCDSTNATKGITAQIVSVLGSMGHSFRQPDPKWVHCPGWTCVLQSGVASALEQAAQSRNDFITLSSAFRSSAEQYLLYQWYLDGHRCGISLAAEPGQSNHEGGRAIDTPNYNYWMSALTSHGWTHSYPSNDPVHFDYLSAANLDQANLLAFQKLWNAHNSNKLTEDGIYGTNTANALRASPCGGW
eukprot:TRINITY_DN173_c0_g1_i2.p1 TRINITY_DN173_c0_g1~~TRINITY_DN173_c0_g1_i2.p1  ORF type:complete len:215 (-),score=38.31 TRINITY_DN173_c0_g1_i2:78-722(-)